MSINQLTFEVQRIFTSKMHHDKTFVCYKFDRDLAFKVTRNIESFQNWNFEGGTNCYLWGLEDFYHELRCIF